MMNRRTFVSLSLATLAAPSLLYGSKSSGKVSLYASVGFDLLHYDVDVANAVLTKRDSITVPGGPSDPSIVSAGLQYAWPHVSGRCLYVVSSDWAKRHYLTALSIDPRTGKLTQDGAPVALPFRPIHTCTDIRSAYVLVAFNDPSGLKVFRINSDLTVGEEVPEPGITDVGIFPHQIRVTPDDRHAILVTRGNSATASKPEDPGALKMFDYDRGILSNEASIAPNGGIGFGPRHLDFHPTKPWVYVSLERESKLYMYRLENGRLAADAAYRKETLDDLSAMGSRQLAGAIHVHPNGRFVYVANRNDGTTDFNGKKISHAAGNNIAVYSIDQITGEPTAIQHMDTRKVYPRTFHIDPSGQLMVAEHNLPVNFQEGDDVRMVPAGMTVFRIGNDGKLTYERTYDVEVGKSTMFWMGMVRL